MIKRQEMRRVYFLFQEKKNLPFIYRLCLIDGNSLKMKIKLRGI